MITYKPEGGVMIHEAAQKALDVQALFEGKWPEKVILEFNECRIDVSKCDTVDDILDAYDRQRVRCA